MIKLIARWKNYSDRARWYIVLVQFLMIVVMFLKSIGLGLEWWHYPIITILTLILLVLLGFVDFVSGIFKAEQEHISNNNPVVMDLQKDIKEILKRLNEKT